MPLFRLFGQQSLQSFVRLCFGLLGPLLVHASQLSFSVLDVLSQGRAGRRTRVAGRQRASECGSSSVCGFLQGRRRGGLEGVSQLAHAEFVPRCVLLCIVEGL